jgi:hypothetical protein
MEPMYSVAELARAADTTEAAIRGLIARKSLPIERRLGGRVYITQIDAEAFARKRGRRLQRQGFALATAESR